MKRQTLSSLAPTLLLTFGCSSEAIDEPSEEMRAQRTQALMSEMETQIENPMRLIGTRQWKELTIEFFDIPLPGTANDPFATLGEVLISRRGPISDGDIVAKLYAASEVQLSPAEIWLALDDDKVEDLPSELAAHHISWTGQGTNLRPQPRTSEFLRIDANEAEAAADRQVEKTISFGTWVSIMRPAIPGHHYVNSQNSTSDQPINHDIVDGRQWFTCSEVTAFTENDVAYRHIRLGSALAVGACGSQYYAAGWIRHGIANTFVAGANPPGHTAAATQCAGWQVDGSWYCTGPIVVPPDHYWLGDMTSNPTLNKVGSYTFSYVDDGGNTSVYMHLGSAKVVQN